MDCESARTAWHRSWDDGIGSAELSEHLAACPACRRYAADMERIGRALGELRSDSEAVVSNRGRVGVRGGRLRVASVLLRVAAAIAILVGAHVVIQRTRLADVATPISQLGEQDPAPAAAPAERRSRTLGITLQGESAATTVACALPSSEPDVQVYWLFPSGPAPPAAGADPMIPQTGER